MTEQQLRDLLDDLRAAMRSGDQQDFQIKMDRLEGALLEDGHFAPFPCTQDDEP